MRKRSIFLNWDAASQPEVGRVGTGIYVKFTGVGAKGRRVIAPSVALDLARQLRSAAEVADVDPTDGQSVEQLLGDLELDADEGTEVIECFDELKSDA